MAIVELVRHGSVAVITLNRPEQRNAFDAPMATALGAAVNELERDPDLLVGVLTAAVTEPRPVFCAGNDLRSIENERDGDPRAETERGGFAGIVTYPRTKPMIVAVDGLATSGGLEVVLACDLVVATRRSSFALAEVKWGLVAGAGGLSASRRVADQPDRGPAVGAERHRDRGRHALRGARLGARRIHQPGRLTPPPVPPAPAHTRSVTKGPHAV